MVVVNRRKPDGPVLADARAVAAPRHGSSSRFSSPSPFRLRHEPFLFQTAASVMCDKLSPSCSRAHRDVPCFRRASCIIVDLLEDHHYYGSSRHGSASSAVAPALVAALSSILNKGCVSRNGGASSGSARESLRRRSWK
jgi:hypothetical protein